MGHPQRMVVTGGAGFVGSHLVDRLLAEPATEIVVLDDLSRGQRQNLAQHRGERRLRFVEGDVGDAARVAALVQDMGVVFHLAAQVTVTGAARDVDRTFTTNVVGTYNVLRACAAGGVNRVVFTSSREVYGEPIELPVAETHPLLAINSYGASKVAAEAWCRAFRRELALDVVVLRLANVYGPRDVGRVIPRWLGRALADDELEVFGGKQVLDFVWVGHVVEALVRAARAPGPLPPINVASGTGIPILDLAQRVARLAGRAPRTRTLAARAIDVVHFVASVQRMRDLLAVEPDVDPLEHLPDLVAREATPAGP